MKREEEREKIARDYENKIIKNNPGAEPYDYMNAVIYGAKWADEDMKIKLIAELTKRMNNAIEEMKKDKTTSTPEYYSSCGQAHAYVQVINMIHKIF